MDIVSFCEKYADDIVCAYRVGSGTIPFLTEVARDSDYVIVVPTEASFRVIKRAIRAEGVNAIGSVFVYLNSKPLQMTPFFWQNHYAERLFGSGYCPQYEEEFLRHTTEYVQFVKDRYEVFGDDLFHDKHAYHYLIGAYILLFHGYGFPAVTESAIRQAHDRGLTEDDVRLILDQFGLKR